MSTSSNVSSASDLNFSQVVRRSVTVFGDRIALTDGDREFTYRELDERTNRLALALTNAGLRRRECVAVLSETRSEFVELYVAGAKIGVAIVGLNTRLHVDEVAVCLEATGARVLFCSEQMIGLGVDAAMKVGFVGQLVAIDEPLEQWLAYEAFLDAAPPGPPPDEASGDDIHAIIFTSGTTGVPKGAMISQRAVVTRALTNVQAVTMTEDDCSAAWLPLFHTGGRELFEATVMAGGCYAIARKADANSLCDLVERRGVSILPLLPGMFNEFSEAASSQGRDLSSLRLGWGYGNLLPIDRLQDFMDRYRVSYFDMYGSCESGITVGCQMVEPGGTLDPVWPKRPGLFVDVKIVDENGSEVSVGESGECLVRGPSLMSGYLNDLNATETAFADGWYHTGDVLTLLEGGSLAFTDRLKYLVKSGGENIYPAEVERVITAHPDVEESFVVRTVDEMWGEAVRAFVIVRDGADLSEDSVAAWCRDRIGGFKRPRYVRFLTRDQVPRTFTGKVVRQELEAIPVIDSERVDGESRGLKKKADAATEQKRT